MEDRLYVNANIEAISKEGSTCLSGSLGNENHFLEERSLLPSLRLSGYFESIKKSCADNVHSPMKSRTNSYEKDLIDTIASCPQTIISSRQSKESSTKSIENLNVSESELNLCLFLDDTKWQPSLSEKSAPRVSPISSCLSNSSYQRKCVSANSSLDNLSILEKERSNCSSEKYDRSPSINHEDSSSSQWRPVLSEYENVSPKRETKPKPQNTFISSSNRDSIRRDTIENQKLDKFEENALIQHLTDQIINLNQWRETAVMEAVEKDRRLTDLQEQLTELQQEFDISKEECLGHQKVIQELKLNLEEAKYEIQYLEDLLTKQSQPETSPMQLQRHQEEYLQPFDSIQKSSYLSPLNNHNTSHCVLDTQKHQKRHKHGFNVRPRTTTPRMYSNYPAYTFSTNSISSNEQEYPLEDVDDAAETIYQDQSNLNPTSCHKNFRIKTHSIPDRRKVQNEFLKQNAQKESSQQNEWNSDIHVCDTYPVHENFKSIRYIDEMIPENKSASTSPPPLCSIDDADKNLPLNHDINSSTPCIDLKDMNFGDNQNRKYIPRLFQQRNT